MNIFVLDNDIKKCVKYHTDKHIVKMTLEYAQILSTNYQLITGKNFTYKITHINHPCTIWARKSYSNFIWLYNLLIEMNKEYKYRYNKEENHKSYDVIMKMEIPKFEDHGLTDFVQAMPEYCKHSDTVIAYRNYYRYEKEHLFNWTKRNKPRWLLND